jgi:transposase InsO family protein
LAWYITAIVVCNMHVMHVENFSRSMAQSMGRAGNCYDNAMMASLWATLKKELVHGRRFRTHDEARTAIVEWIEVCYQRIRIHGSLGYVSSEAFGATERVG